MATVIITLILIFYNKVEILEGAWLLKN